MWGGILWNKSGTYSGRKKMQQKIFLVAFKKRYKKTET